MHRRRAGLPLRIAAMAAVTGVLTACSATAPSRPAASSAPPLAPAVAAPGPAASGGNGHGGRGGSPPTAAALPVDFPADLPVFPGVLAGSTGHGPSWGLLVSVGGGADVVQRAAIAFYVARGFQADSASVVHNTRYRLTMLAANRDHSATRTNLAIAVALR